MQRNSYVTTLLHRFYYFLLSLLLAPITVSHKPKFHLARHVTSRHATLPRPCILYRKK